MKAKFKIFLCLFAAFLVSCDKTTPTETPDTGLTVNFSASVQTRATDTAFETGDEISVTAYDTDGAIYAHNVDYSYDGSIFSSDSPIEYETSASKLSFYAVYPYVEISDSKTVDFTVETDQSVSTAYTLSDLMFSSVDETSISTPQLEFEHLLTKVIINITSSDEDMTDAIAKVYALATAEYDLSTLASTATGSLTGITMASNGTDSYKAVIAPQKIASSTTFGEITVGDNVYEFYSLKSITMQAGKEYVIDAAIESGIITFEEAVIYDWNDEPSEEDTTNESEIIYSAGTWEVISCNPSDYSSDADAAIDDDLSTYFYSESGATASNPHWIVIDLKANYIIEDILLAPRSESYVGSDYAGYIETSINNANWSDAGEFEFAASSELQTFAITPAVARYIRISNQSSCLSLSEFAINGLYYGESGIYPSVSADVTSFSLSSAGQITVTVTTVDLSDEVTYSVQEGYASLESVSDGVYVFDISANETLDLITEYITFACGRYTSVVSVNISPAASIGDNSTFAIDSYSSQETNYESGSATNILDGNTSTYWHSAWSNGGKGGTSSDPDYVVIDLCAYYTVVNVYITPRASGYTNTGYVYTSDDAETWELQNSYTSGSSAAATDVVFSEGVKCRYIKVTVDNTWGMMSEFNIVYTDVESL